MKSAAGSGLIPKVFDKTLLDMARLRTIEMDAEEPRNLGAAQLSAMVRVGDVVFTRFRFAGPVLDPGLDPETVDVVLTGFEKELWQRSNTFAGTGRPNRPWTSFGK